MKAIKNGTIITANVARMGSRNPRPAFAIVQYVADHNCKSGYKFHSRISGTLFPNKGNYDYAAGFEDCVEGRPVAGVSAPYVEGMANDNDKIDGRWIVAGVDYPCSYYAELCNN